MAAGHRGGTERSLALSLALLRPSRSGSEWRALREAGAFYSAFPPPPRVPPSSAQLAQPFPPLEPSPSPGVGSHVYISELLKSTSRAQTPLPAGWILNMKLKTQNFLTGRSRLFSIYFILSLHFKTGGRFSIHLLSGFVSLHRASQPRLTEVTTNSFAIPKVPRVTVALCRI